MTGGIVQEISDYGIIGNLCSAELIGLDGSIDRLCRPHIDSPSLFAALLDDQKGGYLCTAGSGFCSN